MALRLPRIMGGPYSVWRVKDTRVFEVLSFFPPGNFSPPLHKKASFSNFCWQLAPWGMTSSKIPALGQALWHSGLSYHAEYLHPILESLSPSSTSKFSFLLRYILVGSRWEGSSTWVSVTHRGDSDQIPGLRLWPDSSQFTGIEGVEISRWKISTPPMWSACLSCSLCLSIK